MFPFFNPQMLSLNPSALSGLATSLMPQQANLNAALNGRKRELEGPDGKEVINKVQRGGTI